jgi:hypothetical protein
MPFPAEEIAVAMAPMFGLTVEQALNHVTELREQGLIK